MSHAAEVMSPPHVENPNDIPLDAIDVSRPELFRSNTMWRYFERLRRENPVHYCAHSMYGPYWSVTKYRDIMEVETHHKISNNSAGEIRANTDGRPDRDPLAGIDSVRRRFLHS